jgi:hypothetical protein
LYDDETRRFEAIRRTEDRKMSRSDKYSRRALLKRLGMGAALLPLLESEWVEAATCAGTSGPRRAFFIVWANGMLSKSSSWATTGDGWALPTFMSSLEPHKSNITLLDGISYNFVKDSPNPSGGEVSGHACFQGMLTGELFQSFGSSTANNIAGGPSIDQYIGTQLKAKGYKGLTALNTQVYSRSTARLSWRAANDPVVPDADPFHVYSTLFAGATPTTPTTPTTPMPVDKMLKMRKSILDYVGSDLTRFSGTVGTADKQRIDAHLQSVRDIEQQLSNQIDAQSGTGTMTGTATGTGTGTTTTPPPGMACAPPALGAKIDVKDTKFFEAVTKMQIDLAVAAFAADATRVVVLQLGDQGDPDIILSTLGFVAGGQDGNTGNINAYHSIAHRNGSEKVVCDTWFQSQIAYAIASMKNVADADKTLLDNSVLVAMNNMRTGNHEYTNVPALVAGSAGGYFKPGRSLKLTNTPVNQVLVAVANAVGVPTTTFGHAAYGGELAALKG